MKELLYDLSVDILAAIIIAVVMWLYKYIIYRIVPEFIRNPKNIDVMLNLLGGFAWIGIILYFAFPNQDIAAGIAITSFASLLLGIYSSVFFIFKGNQHT